MFEKVNPSHPDKIADRIAGALVDLAYAQEENPRIAVEVLIGHGICTIIAETSVLLDLADVEAAVHRIAGQVKVNYNEYPQDPELARNQEEEIRCGDNGIFKGEPVTSEEMTLTALVGQLYDRYPTDGKFILSHGTYVACQSQVDSEQFRKELPESCIVNPLGDWSGGTDVDTGATNRKLGSDMGRSVTGGGLHGKDLSKADVSVSIYMWLKAQCIGYPIFASCAIGDEKVSGVPFKEIVEVARNYIKSVGGFEKFAEWGLIRP